MKHSIRQRVINSIGLPVVKTETVIGELGSGILDKNGKEIFEGDRVLGEAGTIIGDIYCENGCLKFADWALCDYDGELEIIGHADD